MLSMLPEEFQDVYDDTIPEAKEIRKKMGKKDDFRKKVLKKIKFRQDKDMSWYNFQLYKPCKQIVSQGHLRRES